MSTGFWLNYDNLPIQYGTQKAIPELGGDYLLYGENREVEQLIPLVPFQSGNGTVQVPAPPTTFSGTTTPIAAGIQSMTQMFPLQITAPNTGGTSITLTNTQVFIEQVEVVPLISATGGTSISVGLVTTTGPANTTSTAASSFVQVTSGVGSAGQQILNGLVTATMLTSVGKTTWTAPGSTGYNSASQTAAGGGSWIGISSPLVTNALVPLPDGAWLSTIASGTFTNGLIKLRIKYTLYGNISY
jgi:hypothetical protein